MLYHAKNSFFFLFPFFLLCSISCATVIPVAIPRFPKKKGLKIREVLDGKRNLAIIVVKTDAKTKKKLGDAAEQWGQTIEASVGKYVTELGYFNVIDIGNRKERLKELAYSQSGLTKKSLEIGSEIQAHTFLFVRMTQVPKVTCKIEEVINFAATAIAITARAIVNPRGGGSVNTGIDTGVLYVSLFMEGKLTNIETGRSVSHLFTKTERQASEAGNRSCLSPNAAFAKILEEGGRQIAKNLSPKLTRLSVPLMEKSKYIKSSLRAKVDTHLMEGVKWAKSGAMENAKTEWEMALKNSKDQSGEAMWNLGVYYWHQGNFQKAQSYFETLKKHKPYLLDQKKRRIIAIFNQER